MSNTGVHLLGVLALIVGLACGASVAGLSSTWIAIGAFVLLGLGIADSMNRKRHAEHPSLDE